MLRQQLYFVDRVLIRSLAAMCRTLPGAPKKYPLKNFANFSRTIEMYDIKFHTLVTHPIVP